MNFKNVTLPGKRNTLFPRLFFSASPLFGKVPANAIDNESILLLMKSSWIFSEHRVTNFFVTNFIIDKKER